MSCRHDLANGTCLRCYPKSGSLDPGSESDYEPNLEGPGAVTKEQFMSADSKQVVKTIRGGGLEFEQAVVACKNIGYDLTCSRCAEVFYTGATTSPHDGHCSTYDGTIVDSGDGVDRISAERRRQIEREGFDAEHDAQHPDGSMTAAAICYASDEPIYIKDEHANGYSFKDPWPWEERFDKRPRSGNVVVHMLTLDERLALLTKAGALIAAEIDNLLYKSTLAAKKTPFAEP